MHWFKLDIKVTLFETTWMNEEEFGFYLKILCFYYDSERGINENLEEIFQFLKIKNKKKKSIVEKILLKNFTKVDDQYIDEDIEEKIKDYQKNKEINKKNGSSPKNNYSQKDKRMASDAVADGKPNIGIKEFSNLGIQESNNLTEDLREDTERAREDSAAIASEPVAVAPVSKPKKTKKIIENDIDFRGELIARGVEPENADTWIAVRAAKGAINNLVAIKLLETQAAIAGMTTNDAVMTAAGSGWSGFKAAWVKDDMKLSQPKVQFKSAAERREENNQRVMEESIKRWEERMKEEESAGIVVDASQLLN